MEKGVIELETLGEPKSKERIGKVREILANEKLISERRLERLKEDSEPLPYRTVDNRKKIEYQEKRVSLLKKTIEWLNEKQKTQKDIDLKELTKKTQEIEETLHKVKFDKKLENENMENYTFRQGVLSDL